MKSTTKTLIKRAVAFVIDWNLILAFSFAMFLVGPQFDVKYLMLPSVEAFSSYGVIIGVLGLLALPLVRDCIFRNASLGKLIMGLRVVDVKTDCPPSIVKMLIRNLTFYFWAADLIAMLANHGVSVGDSISSTTVIEKKR